MATFVDLCASMGCTHFCLFLSHILNPNLVSVAADGQQRGRWAVGPPQRLKGVALVLCCSMPVSSACGRGVRSTAFAAPNVLACMRWSEESNAAYLFLFHALVLSEHCRFIVSCIWPSWGLKA